MVVNMTAKIVVKPVLARVNLDIRRDLTQPASRAPVPAGEVDVVTDTWQYVTLGSISTDLGFVNNATGQILDINALLGR